MALQFQVDSLDRIPESLREHYAEVDGTWRITLDGFDFDKNAAAKKSANAEARDRRIALEAYAPFGSPEEIAAKLAAVEPVTAELGATKAERDKAAADRDAAQIHAKIVATLAAHRATPAGIDLMPRVLTERVRMADVDGKRVMQILAADGTPIAGGTLADLVKESIAEYGSLFEGTGGHGGGTSPRSAERTATRTISRNEFERLPPADQASRVRDGFTIHD